MAFKSYLKEATVCIMLLFAGLISYGQTVVTISGKTFSIPTFGNDTLTQGERYVKEDSLLIAHKFIKPLAQSKDEFEARCFVKTADIGNHFIMIILKGNKNKLTAERFDCRYVAILSDGTPGIVLGKYESIWIQQNQRRVNLKTDTSFAKLVELGLFDYPDKKTFKGGKDLPTMERDSQTDYVVEIKLNGKYHSFRYYSDLLKNDPDNKRLSDGKAIINAFFDLAGMKSIL